MMTILSLFDSSGQWSKPYRDAGYNVVQIDLKLGTDVMEVLRMARIGETRAVHGILAAPPCTDFSGSGAQYWPAKDADGRTEASLRLIDATLELVALLRPHWWAMENPVGRLNRLRPALAKVGPRYFHPCDYAGWLADPSTEAYTKKTGLWGKFAFPNKRPVEPVMFTTKNGKRGSWFWAKLGGKSERTKELRSITPAGFACAFYLSNP